MKMTSLC